jgi:hypothetical protein
MHNRKRRTKLTTALVVGEGETEGAFLNHLKELYHVRGVGVQVKVDWAYGGSPEDIVTEAVKSKQNNSYSRAIILLDTDVVWPPAAIKLAEENDFILVGTKPCIEGLLLKIVDQTKDWSVRSTQDCERNFHNNCIAEDHKVDCSKYTKLFTKDIMEEARKRIPELDQLLNLMFKE